MAALTKHKSHSQFSGSLEVVEVEYDFANDGGSTGAKDIVTFPSAMVIIDAWTKIDTAVVGTSSTLIWGVKGGDTDACLDATSGAEANLTIGAVIPGESACKNLKLAAGAIMEMTIGTAALTAGKVRFCLLVQKF